MTSYLPEGSGMAGGGGSGAATEGLDLPACLVLYSALYTGAAL